PGFHVLAALVGAWTGTDGLHATYPIIAASVALKAGFVYLIALRLVPDDVPRALLAAVAPLLLLLPSEYFIDSFTRSSILSQVMSELFVVVLWWALVVWDEASSRGALMLYAIAGSAAFLTLPVIVGPALAILPAVVLLRRGLPGVNRLEH